MKYSVIFKDKKVVVPLVEVAVSLDVHSKLVDLCVDLHQILLSI